MSETQTKTIVKAKQPLYCEICTWPPEYCQYGSRLSKCKTWLSEAQPDLFASIYGSSSSTSNTAPKAEGETGLEKPLAATALDKEAAKKEAKAVAKEEKAEKKRASSKILIKRIERNKRKFVTAIHGLEVFGQCGKESLRLVSLDHVGRLTDIDLKKASKLFANKFATGASVSKNNQGEDEIVIQGDVAYEVEELLQDKTPKIAAVLGGGKIPEDNVDIIDSKK